MKALYILLIWLLPWAALAQKSDIPTVLNNALQNEYKLQRLHPTNDYKVSWHHMYRIDYDFLSIRFTKTDTLTKCACTVYRSVKIKNINSVAKDINVVFLTKPNAVKEILMYQPCAANNNTQTIDTLYSNMFFTELKTQKNNDDLGRRLQDAFAKQKQKIKMEYWYD